MNKTGWLVNDTLTCIPGTITFWHNLLEWNPYLIDKTNGYTNFAVLSQNILNDINSTDDIPSYIIRNGTYFGKINTKIKQISLIQDIQEGHEQTNQIDVINNSTVCVFNTEYVYNKYRALINSSVLIKIIPLGVNFDFFKPITEKHPEVLPNSILFIGDNSNYPKGFNVLLNIVEKMNNQNFCLVMKNDFNNIDPSYSKRIKIFNRVDHTLLRTIINSCVGAVCTSYEETQHLSGIECGACNIPIVAREVGIYHSCKNDPRWGLLADDSNFVEKINNLLENLNSYKPRDCFIEKYTVDICKNNWIELIKGI